MELRRSLVAPAAFILLGYVALLVIVPVVIAPDPSAPNAAAVLGYNIEAAYWTAVIWTVVSSVFVLTVVAFGAFKQSSPAEQDEASVAHGQWRWGEVALVFGLTILAHWPSFLARYGPYAEDNYFLSTLARMQCGQHPFADFEFIYGPLMIAAAHAWMQAVGYSMANYYWLYALLQGALFAALLLALQRFITDRRQRLVVFVLLIVLMADVLLGLNWIGWRRMLSLFAILVVAARPHDIRAAAVAGMILAVHLAYSFEYACAGLAACGVIYVVTAVAPIDSRGRTILCGLISLGIAITGAIMLIALSTSGDVATYLSATLSVLRQASESGLGAFKFYWTAHTLALFGLLSVGLAAVAVGATRFRGPLSEGDRLLIGALAFALVALKIAFQRADIWHMGPPFFPLAFVVLAGSKMKLFALDAPTRRVAVALVSIATIANLIGVAPIGTLYVKGLVHGALDVMRGVPQTGPISARTYSVQSERSHADSNLTALAAFLAQPELRERPVLLYGRMWWLNSHIGVCPAGYLNYEWMYGDERHPIADLVAAHPNILVVLTEMSYTSLRTGESPPVTPPNLARDKRLALWTSTVHYRQSPIEYVIKDRLWRSRIGDSLARTHTEIARFGNYVVLGSRDAAAEEVKP